MGFRRILAALFVHTNSHILAAPMAHYLAKTGSRFTFSHDSFFLPVYGMDHMMKDRPMNMHFKDVLGTQVMHHPSMHYYFRSEKLESMCCFLQFF